MPVDGKSYETMSETMSDVKRRRDNLKMSIRHLSNLNQVILLINQESQNAGQFPASDKYAYGRGFTCVGRALDFLQAACVADSIDIPHSTSGFSPCHLSLAGKQS